MNYGLEFLKTLLLLDGFFQHLGKLELLKIYGILDIIIILANYIIAAMLIYLYVQRSNIIKYSWILLIFSGLFVLNGTNFFIEIYQIWQSITFN